MGKLYAAVKTAAHKRDTVRKAKSF